MDLVQVRALFARLAGMSADAAGEWQFLCDAAAGALQMQARPGANLGDERLSLAAAGEAYYQYCLSRGADSSAESVKIGEVAVTGKSSSGGDAADARALREALYAGAAPLLLGPADGIRQVG